MATYSSWCPAFGEDELISFHPAGGLVLLCDGSAQFLPMETDVGIIFLSLLAPATKRLRKVCSAIEASRLMPRG